MTQELKVRTHVARDLLQTAQLFRRPEAAIWEYVVNSIEYADREVHPEVFVRIDRAGGEVVVADNGRGMDVAGTRVHVMGPPPARGHGVPRRRSGEPLGRW